MSASAAAHQIHQTDPHQIGEPINPFKKFNGFFIPEWLADKDISTGAKLVYGALCRYAGRDGSCFPKLETIGAALNINRSTVCSHILELKNHRLIRTHRRGLGQSNEYEFLAHEWMEGHYRPRGASDFVIPEIRISEKAKSLHIEESQKKETTTTQAEPVRADHPGNVSSSSFSSPSKADHQPDHGYEADESEETAQESPQEAENEPRINPEIIPLVETIPTDKAALTPSLVAMIEKNVNLYGMERVERNLRYALERSRSNFRGYLAVAVANDYAAEIEEERAASAAQISERAEAEKRRTQELIANINRAVEEREAETKARVDFWKNRMAEVEAIPGIGEIRKDYMEELFKNDRGAVLEIRKKGWARSHERAFVAWLESKGHLARRDG